MDKSAYVRGLLLEKYYDPRLLEAALVYWHSGIPFKDAVVYLNNLSTKFNQKEMK